MLINNKDHVFIPISLGNHYYSNSVLEFIRDNVIPNCLTSHILICDRLRVLIYQMRYVKNDINIVNKVGNEVKQFTKTLNNLDIPRQKTQITTWDIVADSLDYSLILQKIFKLSRSNEEVQEYVQSLAQILVGRFYEGNPSELIFAIQRQYILEETAISIYMTEILGLSKELYRREEDGLIKYLYDYQSSWLREILDKNRLERRFISLESLIKH